MPNRFDDTFREYHKKITGGTKLLSGLLGIYLGGTQRISVPNRPNYVYVRLRDSQSEVIQAYNETVSLIFGLPVVLFWEGNRYVIKGKDTGRYGSYWGYDEAYYLPAHGAQHSLSLDVGGGGDPTFIYGRQFIPLGAFPSGTANGGGVVLGDNFVFRKPDNSWMVFGVTGTPDFTTYNPTGSSAIMLLLYGDTDTGNLGFIVNSGSPFDNSITGTYGIVPYLPTYSDDTWLPMFGIRLTSGTKTINYTSMYDVRQYYTPQATGSAGQDLSGYITGSWSLLNGAFAPTGTGGGGDVTGSWDLLYGTFAASGTAGGQTTWIGFYDDDVFVASGTHISYGDNLNVVATGSVAYVSADVITGAFITGGGGGGGSILQFEYVEGTTGTSNTTSTWEDLAEMSITITTLSTTVFEVGFHAGIGNSTSNGTANFRLMVDGVQEGDTIGARVPVASIGNVISFIKKVGNQTADSHTFKIQWEDSVGTPQSRPDSQSQEGRFFWVKEILLL